MHTSDDVQHLKKVLMSVNQKPKALPTVPDGFAQKPVIDTIQHLHGIIERLEDELAQFSNPVCTDRSYIRYAWDAEIGEPVICWLDYEAPERATADCPGDPGAIALVHAYLRGLDIAAMLTDEQIERIENEALASLEQAA